MAITKIINTDTPAGSNTEVQYNDNGVFGSSSNLTFDGTILTQDTATGDPVHLLATDDTTNAIAYTHHATDYDGTAREGKIGYDWSNHAYKIVTGSGALGSNVNGICIKGDSTFNVGIGTAGPASKLHINQPTDQAIGLRISQNDATGSAPTTAPMWIQGTNVAGTNTYFALGNGGIYTSGILWSGDTLNANITVGATLNQRAHDNEILAFKSTDVAHAMTTLAETDTYGTMSKQVATLGSLRISGYAAAGTGCAIELFATPTDVSSTKSASGDACIRLRAQKRSGTSATPLAANENVVLINDSNGAVWICDADGDVHYDGTTNASAWDDYDDIALLNTMRSLTTGNKAQEVFGDFIDENAQLLADTGVITLNDDGHHFVSTKGLNALIIDTIRQEGKHWRNAIAARDLEIAELKESMTLLQEKN